MISNRTEYEFVTGDLDGILIDGDIMPLRTGDTGKFDKNDDPISRKNLLRGEDICFLKEAIEERRRAVGKTDDNPVFSKKISTAQITETDTKLRDIEYDNPWPGDPSNYYRPWEWIDSVPDTTIDATTSTLPDTATYRYFNMSGWNEFGVDRIVSPSPLDLDGKLNAADISSMFASVDEYEYFVESAIAGVHDKTHTFSISKTNLGGNYQYYSDLCSGYVDSWCHSPGKYLYDRHCMALNDHGVRRYAGWEGIINSVSTPAYANEYAKACRIFGVFELASSVSYGVPGQSYDSESLTHVYRLKYINDGFSVDSSRLVSIVQGLKNELVLKSPSETMGYASTTDSLADFTANVFLSATFPVYELRDRTRWAEEEEVTEALA